MAVINLTQGKFVIVDEEDFELLNQWKWCLGKKCVVRHEQKSEYGSNIRKMVKMHRFIMKVNGNEFIYHINRNPLDNRKCNLRIATNSQNQANSKLCKMNTTGYRGIVKYNQKKAWAAQIYIKGKRIFKGMFQTKEEAALKYNELAKTYFGEFANLNVIKL